MCVPSGITEIERKAVEEATYQAGAREVFLVEEPIAAAIGAGVDITKPFGNLIVDIGGGTTDIAVISIGGVVVSSTIKVAGDAFDQAIMSYIRKTHSLFIGSDTAEAIKIKIGTAFFNRRTSVKSDIGIIVCFEIFVEKLPFELFLFFFSHKPCANLFFIFTDNAVPVKRHGEHSHKCSACGTYKVAHCVYKTVIRCRRRALERKPVEVIHGKFIYLPADVNAE